MQSNRTRRRRRWSSFLRLSVQIRIVVSRHVARQSARCAGQLPPGFIRALGSGGEHLQPHARTLGQPSAVVQNNHAVLNRSRVAHDSLLVTPHLMYPSRHRWVSAIRLASVKKTRNTLRQIPPTHLALPHNKHFPSRRPERPPHPLVTRGIATQLPQPVLF